MANSEVTRRVNIYINGDVADATLKTLGATSRKLYNELANLAPGTEAFIKKSEELRLVNGRLQGVKEDIKGVTTAANTMKQALEALGVAFSVAAIVEFGKELFSIEVKASGVQNAFAKIGNTAGYLDKLKESSKGLIGDLDLERIAVKANNANIPIEKMGTFLKFAAERARDTGENVTELTEKLIEGLGKGTPKALAGLGISVVQIKDEFKKTGDMVQAVENIINRQMLAAGDDVDTFGARMIKLGVTWDNFKEKAAGFLQSLFTPDIADPEEIAKSTDLQLEKFKNFHKYSKEQLEDSIKEQKALLGYYKEDYDKSQADLQKLTGGSGVKEFGKSFTKKGQLIIEAAKEQAEAYQGARNALSALNKEYEKYNSKQDGSIDGINQEITRLKTLQAEMSKTSADWKSYQDQIEALQKKADAITGKKAKEDPAIKKAQEELKQYQSQLLEARDQLDKLIASATKGTEAGLNAELKVITEKYEKIVAKLKELNNSKFATPADKDNNNKLIGSAKKAEGDEKEKVTGDFNYAAFSKAISDDAKKQADLVKHQAAQGLKTKDQLAEEEYKIEQKRLKEMYDLDVIYGVDTAELEKQNADNELKEKERLHEQSMNLLKEQLQEEKDFAKAKEGIEMAKQDLANATMGVLNDIFGKNKALMIAELALEKGIAIGKIEAQEGVEIAGYWAKYALIPGGEVIAATLSAAATTRAGLSIAAIVATGIGEAIADLSSGGGSGSAKKYADGGYTAVDYSKPQGFVRRPTLFTNSSSGRAFTAGEGHKTEYVVSSTQLRDPMVANFVGMLEANRTVRRFEAGGYTATGLSTAQGGGQRSEVRSNGGYSARLDRIEAALEKQAQINEIPVTFNNRAYDTQANKNVEIKNNANA